MVVGAGAHVNAHDTYGTACRGGVEAAPRGNLEVDSAESD